METTPELIKPTNPENLDETLINTHCINTNTITTVINTNDIITVINTNDIITDDTIIDDKPIDPPTPIFTRNKSHSMKYTSIPENDTIEFDNTPPKKILRRQSATINLLNNNN